MAVGQEFNFVIHNDHFESNKDLIDPLFDGKDVQILLLSTQESHLMRTVADMFDILVMTGLFRSKSEARKNWKRTGKDIPEGFTDIKNIGKLHHRLTIWNPIGGRNEG